MFEEKTFICTIEQIVIWTFSQSDFASQQYIYADFF